MNDLGASFAGAIGILIALTWFALILLALGLVAFALRRRAFRRGTHPLRLLPWYLGGPPEIPIDLPADRKRARQRRRGH